MGRVAMVVVLLAGCGGASPEDAGASDAGASDAAASDAGASDAGASDAGTSDAGTSDAGAATGCAAAGCGASQFCETLPGDCASGEDRCSLVPELCPPGGEPVCGCDGVTYPSDCERRRARASKAFDGPCAAVVCDPPCTGVEVCWYRADGPAMGCGVAGQCVPPPPPCGLTPYEPVCGCDGTTYDHEWCALQAGAGIASSGPCP